MRARLIAFSLRACLAALATALLLAHSIPGETELAQAYDALATKDYDRAIELFRQAAVLQPGNPAIHEDLAYTLLKTGDNEAARDEFAAALKLNPKDESAALEYAFLAYETKQPIEARRMFDKLRHSESAATRQTAEQAFQNIDKPLGAGIARWAQALAQSPKHNDPSMFSAHWELAQLAELRDELVLSAREYEICRQLKPQRSEILLCLARVWKQLNRGEDSQAALLAASRSTDSRTAEQALELYGARYPYPYEFLAALKLDPQNLNLRRELAYLYLAMNDKRKAIEQFEQLLALNPKDFAARAQLNELRGFKTRPEYIPHSSPSAALDPKQMGLKSLALGYNNDAVKYLLQALEQDPTDSQAMLKLGWAYNALKRDDEAKAWFEKARYAEDRQVAVEAAKAFHNLNGDLPPQTTVWALPMYSSRWHDVFAYGQVKRSIPLPWLGAGNRFLSFYLSTRFIGDARSSTVSPNTQFPQYLSESAFIVGAGLSTKPWHRFTAWAEAGESIRYLDRRDVGAAVPDYRGGLNYAKGFGALLGATKTGFYYETTADAVYLSRFGKDWLLYSQNRAGRTWPIGEGNTLQFLLNGNMVTDLNRQYWANTVEFGPGIKFRPRWLPKNVYFSGDFLRGAYLLNAGNPRRPNYNDVRAGFWYAVTK